MTTLDNQGTTAAPSGALRGLYLFLLLALLLALAIMFALHGGGPAAPDQGSSLPAPASAAVLQATPASR